MIVTGIRSNAAQGPFSGINSIKLNLKYFFISSIAGFFQIEGALQIIFSQIFFLLMIFV